jgi:hypothetical protein
MTWQADGPWIWTAGVSELEAREGEEGEEEAAAAPRRRAA